MPFAWCSEAGRVETMIMAVFSQGIFPPSGFWDFSTRLYAQAEVEEVCLRLQGRHGINVNVILYCCWVASSGRGEFRDGELEAALAASASWHDNASHPLRTLRAYLRGDLGAAQRRLADELSRVIAECEVYAEHIEQIILEDSLERLGTGTFDPAEQVRAATENLSAYFGLVDVNPDAEDRAAAATLLKHSFPDAADWLIKQLVGI